MLKTWSRKPCPGTSNQLILPFLPASSSKRNNVMHVQSDVHSKLSCAIQDRYQHTNKYQCNARKAVHINVYKQDKNSWLQRHGPKQSLCAQLPWYVQHRISLVTKQSRRARPTGFVWSKDGCQLAGPNCRLPGLYGWSVGREKRRER